LGREWRSQVWTLEQQTRTTVEDRRETKSGSKGLVILPRADEPKVTEFYSLLLPLKVLIMNMNSTTGFIGKASKARRQ
jgi:hypothetical protein